MMRPMWLDAGPAEADTYAAFRGSFELDRPADVEIRTLGASWFVIWLDGAYLAEGPLRYHRQHPEYGEATASLAGGRHVLAAQVHFIGATTRMLENIPPFFACHVLDGSSVVPVRWRCTALDAYMPRVRRINPQLGWVEWCDTRKLAAGWTSPDFDDSSWREPVEADPGIGSVQQSSIGPVRQFVHLLSPMRQGELVEVFGYERDDPPARFMLRRLEGSDLPADGVWRRYDLGRVRLGRIHLTLDLPTGAQVEIAASEALTEGRVLPYINLSTGPSCNLDHFIARGGVQEFFPLMPKGGRFVEVHVLADPRRVRFEREEFLERCYVGEPEGAFDCDDERINCIWSTGVETLRACAEDAMVDNPTRERGQWTGDTITVGLENTAVLWHDLRLLRRCLVQAAQSARPDGLVAGMSPGGVIHVPSFAAAWVSACVRYHQLTGDRQLMEDLYHSAARNMAAFEKYLGDDGLKNDIGWVFVDWAYRSRDAVDPALNLLYIRAVRAMMRWCALLDRGGERSHYQALAERLTRFWGSRLGEDWPELGYHVSVLALRLGLVASQRERACIDFIKRYMLNAFPNRPDAPRVSGPSITQPSQQLISPYFCHFALPPLIERGEMDFVLDQYRNCWGWMLSGGFTTWLEVFDERASHCHHWSGCPTWQLSRYVLGLHPRFDRGPGRVDLLLLAGSLTRAAGRLPLPDGGTIEIEWRREKAGIRYRAKSSAPICVRLHELHDAAAPEFPPATEFSQLLPLQSGPG